MSLLLFLSLFPSLCCGAHEPLSKVCVQKTLICLHFCTATTNIAVFFFCPWCGRLNRLTPPIQGWGLCLAFFFPTYFSVGHLTAIEFSQYGNLVGHRFFQWKYILHSNLGVSQKETLLWTWSTRHKLNWESSLLLADYARCHTIDSAQELNNIMKAKVRVFRKKAS